MKAIVKHRGERIDRIARATLGTEGSKATEALLAANPGLSERMVKALDSNIPAGTAVDVPSDFAPPDPAGIVLAWE
ncbi:tail protein X [Shinella sp.]|uniref:tail protein X n=1 Tax=Shinella sp. TaxID=1870904 RepID=UPI0029B7BE67|nr:tail protein X [Shinella sp.]MDX3978931.1 tail protein X [Shinella sp.]